MYANQHEAFAIVAKDVREAANSFPAPKAPLKGGERLAGSRTRVPQEDRSSNLRIKRSFDDHERDAFLEDSYEYMARYFDGSLQCIAPDFLDTRTS
jgi:hypothetical protein